MAPSSSNKKKADSNNTKSSKDKGKASSSTTNTNTTSTSNSGGSNKDEASKLKPATAINVRHILCEKHSQKESALSALVAGSRFDDVAREHSCDKARQGGSLGWKVRGSLDAGFEKAAYALEVSGVGKPVWAEVKSGFGYHIIMVEGRR